MRDALSHLAAAAALICMGLAAHGIAKATEPPAVIAVQGAPGPIGPQGPSGAAGAQGLPGEPGPAGAQGSTGPAGESAYRGPLQAVAAAAARCTVAAPAGHSGASVCAARYDGVTGQGVAFGYTATSGRWRIETGTSSGGDKPLTWVQASVYWRW